MEPTCLSLISTFIGYLHNFYPTSTVRDEFRAFACLLEDNTPAHLSITYAKPSCRNMLSGFRTYLLAFYPAKTVDGVVQALACELSDEDWATFEKGIQKVTTTAIEFAKNAKQHPSTKH